MENSRLEAIQEKARACKFCEARIVFLQTKEGRPMPCEEKPVTLQTQADRKVWDGTRLISIGGEVFIPDLAPLGEPLFVTHWKRCPGAHLARKSDRKRAREGGVRR